MVLLVIHGVLLVLVLAVATVLVACGVDVSEGVEVYLLALLGQFGLIEFVKKVKNYLDKRNETGNNTKHDNNAL